MAFTFPASEQKEVMAVDMSIDTEIKNAVSATDQDAQYDDKLRKDVSAMCNLSQGIRERTVAERDEKNILNMHREGYTSEQIAKIVERTIGEVEAIIKKREPVLA